MRIIRIDINEFGPFRFKSFEFAKDLNLVIGDNESGKSTLLLFIKYMLYGIAKKSKTGAVSEIDRAVCRMGDGAGGSMTVEHGGRIYKIERRFSRTSKGTFVDKVQMKDVESGTVITGVTSPGEELLRIPYEVFENSCMISQLGGSAVNGEKIGASMRNILSSADESQDAEKAIKNLDSLRVKYLHKDSKGGIIYELRQKQADLKARYRSAIDDNMMTDSIKSDLGKTEKKIAEVAEKQRIADDLVSKIQQRTVLKLFDKLHEYESVCENDKDRLARLENEFSVGGTLIGREHLAKLTSAYEELSVSRKSYDDAFAELENAKKNIKLSNEDKELIDTAIRMGGIEVLKREYQTKKKRISAHGIVSLVCGALAILSLLGVVAVFMLAEGNKLSALTGAAFAVFALLAILFVISRANAKKKLSARFSAFGMGVKDIEDLIKKIELLIIKKAEFESGLKTLEETVDIKYRLLGSCIERANILVETVGGKKQNYADGVLNELSALAGRISEYCGESERLKAQITANKSNIEQLTAELSDYNEHRIRRQVSDEILSMTDDQIKEAKREKSYYDLQIKALNDKKLSNDRALLERKYTTEDPFMLSAQLSQTERELEGKEKSFDAVIMALEALTQASANLKGAIAPKIRGKASGYMDIFSGGKYGADSISFDDSLEMSMEEDGFVYPIDLFSAGTKDAAYLSMRFALLDILSEQGNPPVFMDETLAMIDDKRSAKILEFISKYATSGGQCILFSCQDREKRICSELGLDFNTVEM